MAASFNIFFEASRRIILAGKSGKRHAHGTKFKSCADFVRQAYKGALLISGELYVQWEHVLNNNIHLNFIQHEIAPGIFKRRPRMADAVPLVLFPGNVPVVKIIVVQERAAHQAAGVHADVEFLRQPKAHIGDGETVLITRCAAVLPEIFLRLHTGRGEHFISVFQNKL